MTIASFALPAAQVRKMHRMTNLIYRVLHSPKASGALNVGMLIWSIINLCCLCTPLGIAGLILTIIAKDAFTKAEEDKKLKGAKICNLIGSIGFVIVGILYVVFMIAGLIGMSSGELYH